jgi:Cys-rich repeat protein
MPDPTNQNDQNTNQDPSTQVIPPSDPINITPPTIPDFQSTDSSATPPMMQSSTLDSVPPVTPVVEESIITPSEDQGSSAPSDLPPVTPSGPKKKFGGGKIIATILGFLILAGGIAGGVILTQQQQDIREKASESCISNADCGSGQTCLAGKCSTIGGGVGTGDGSGLGGNVDEDKGCNSDNQCGKGQECQGGKCRDKPDGVGGGVGTGDGSGLGGNVDPDKTCTFDSECGSGGKCQGGKCVEDDGSGLGSSINCGGVQCSPEDCHCQGGDACTSLRCEPDIRVSCGNQGRAWCDNFQAGAGKTCCFAGYVCNPNGEGCVPSGNGTPPPGGGGPTAQCQNIKAYSPTWTLLTAAQLSQLKATDQVNFCVAGTTTQGTFDKGKFTINGVAQAETTTKRPSSSDFCQLYTIPAGTNSFSISAQIHHATLGWK